MISSIVSKSFFLGGVALSLMGAVQGSSEGPDLALEENPSSCHKRQKVNNKKPISPSTTHLRPSLAPMPIVETYRGVLHNVLYAFDRATSRPLYPFRDDMGYVYGVWVVLSLADVSKLRGDDMVAFCAPQRTFGEAVSGIFGASLGNNLFAVSDGGNSYATPHMKTLVCSFTTKMVRRPKRALSSRKDLIVFVQASSASSDSSQKKELSEQKSFN